MFSSHGNYIDGYVCFAQITKVHHMILFKYVVLTEISGVRNSDIAPSISIELLIIETSAVAN